MPPLCPICSSPMVRRIAHQSQPDEHEFWSCPRFPECRGARSIGKENAPADQLPGHDSEQIITPASIRFEGEPYDGYDMMATYESLACDSSVFSAMRNSDLNPEILRNAARFRLDFKENDNAKTTAKQRQICNLVLRMLCRGTVTMNSKSVEDFLRMHSPCTVELKDSDFIASRRLTHTSPAFIFDSEREEKFADTILPAVLGPDWSLYTQTQILISTMCSTKAPEDVGFAGQRVDFVVSTGTRDYVIELDGDEHQNHRGKDARRDEFLKQNGYTIIRISNDDLDEHPESVIARLRSVIKPVNASADPNSDPQCRILVMKLVHQLQIALTSGLIHAAIPARCSVNLFADIDGFDQNDMDILLRLAVYDLDKLFRQFCALYDVPRFFDLEPVSASDSDAFTLCIGRIPETETDDAGIQDIRIQITDITVAHPVENFIPPCSDLPIANIDKSILFYFLEYIFRFTEFHEGQQIALERLLSSQDTIVLLPTGSGKSLIYQMAALICPGKIIVVSPLVALMQDQLDNLFFYGIDCAIAISRDSGRATAELNNPGKVLIYISPERLQIRGFRNCIDAMQASSRIFAVAVDEAHCVSEWGHDFRTAYLNIGRTSRAVFNRNGLCPTIIALTGTASTAVLKDVKRELEITDYDAIITPETFDRPELTFKVVRANSDHKKQQLVQLIETIIPDYFGKSPSSFYRLKGDDTYCGIVFCPHVNGDYGVMKVQGYLSMTSTSTDVYSGSKPKMAQGDWDQKKRQVAAGFKANQLNILVATKAFGMGIDKPNIRYTIHYGIPSSIESFYQEAGRAGRSSDSSKKDSLCVVILSAENERQDALMLNPTTPLDQVQQMVRDLTIDRKDDISRSMWFHVDQFKGIPFEMYLVQGLIDWLFEGDTLKTVSVTLCCGTERTDNSLENTQKALQRLLVLGVIADYTVDYSAREVQIKPGSANPIDIQARYAAYVKGYNEGRIARELEKLARVPEDPRHAYVSNAALVLTEFIYDTIEKGRRRGLREMANAAEVALASQDPDKTLRQRIVRYFESTYSQELDEIVDGDGVGFEKIPGIIDGTTAEDSEEVVGGIRSANEASGLRGGVSRYLESTPDHPGLLALRALAELHCRDCSVAAIRDDFEAAVDFAVSRYSCDRRSLQNLINYFMRKVLERAPKFFKDLAGTVESFMPKTDLCESLMEDRILTIEQRIVPAFVYFNEMAVRANRLLNRIKEE